MGGLFNGNLEILRLKHLGYSQRQIIGSVGCSSHTIKDTWEAAQELNLQWSMPENTTNEELKTILFPNKNKPVQLFAEPDYAYIHGELAKSGVTLTLLWEEYRKNCYMECKTPYQYTRFAVKYNKWARSTKATMRIKHKPGDSMEVDWAGDTIPYYDPISGEAYPAYLFVAVLPCSLYVYATVCSDMKLENWLNCHINAFEYFGGVARLLIPDNCKTATTQNSKFDVVLNRSYQELTAHYGTAIVPARVRKPKDKSHAEVAVRMVETWILAALRNQKFFSLSEMREAVAEKLEELNTRAFSNRSGNRKTAFLEEELQYMLPLPNTPYEAAVWSVAKVPNDYVVTDGLNKYSVPYVLIGEKVEKVDIKVTRNIVEVFYKGSKVASHKRMPSLHRESHCKRGAHASADRIRVWKSCFNMISDYPVTGVGLGNFREVYNKGHYRLNTTVQDLVHSHNNYLQLWSESGTVGFIGFMTMSLYILITNMKLWFKTKSPFSLMIWGSWLSFMIFGMFDLIIDHSAITKVWWFLLGMLLVLENDRKMNSKEECSKF